MKKMDGAPSRYLYAASLACLTLLLSACHQQETRAAAPPQPEVKPAPPTPIALKKVELGSSNTWDPQWDVIVERGLPPEMLSSQVPRDVRHFCPRFYDISETDKRAFWAYFFQALAGAEAGLDPKTHVRHTEPEVAVRDRVTGRMVRSEGLLQLTYQDQQRYGCDFNWEADKTLKPSDPARTILQPKNNLECGLKILKKQIIDDHKPLLASTGYWATLQPARPSYRVFAKEMVNPPAACGLTSKGRPEKTAPIDQRLSASR